MTNNQKMDQGHLNSCPVFVIGSGRSGTHWLGFSLYDHPEVHATIEKQPMFELSTMMALQPELEQKLFAGLVREYKKQLLNSESKIYLDKSHPNIWISEKLKKAFPQSLFIGIERNPYATVASMMQHKGVLGWHTRWRKYPIPNRFLGITKELAKTYDQLPLASQCAIRWLAHHEKMQHLQNVLQDDLLLITYEFFAYNTEKVIHQLQDFLGLHSPIPMPEVKIDSLQKWKTQLSAENIKHIQDVVGLSPDAFVYEQVSG